MFPFCPAKSHAAPCLAIVILAYLTRLATKRSTSIDRIKVFKAELEGFDYDLVLTGHNMPEGRDAVQTKIEYLTKTAEIAESAKSADDFIAQMHEAFPDYAGDNYLEMTAGFLFPAAQ